MNKITLLAGIAIGAVLTAGVAQLQAQAPAAADTHRPAVFVITLQNDHRSGQSTKRTFSNRQRRPSRTLAVASSRAVAK